MPFTIPPSNKIAGQSGFITDIDNTYAALSAVTGINVLNSAYAGGADPGTPSTPGADSSAAFQAAMDAATGTGSVQAAEVIIPPGNYTVSGLHINGPLKIRGLGAANSYNSVVTGAVSTLPGVTLNCAASTYLFNMPSQGYLWGGLEMSGININFTGTGNVFDSVNFADSVFRDMTITLTQSGSMVMTCSGSNSVLNVLHERCTFATTNATRSNPMFSISSSIGAAISNNTFYKCKFGNYGKDNTQFMVLIQCTGGGTAYHVADNFIECWFEHAYGGVYKSLSGSNIKVDGCIAWDVQGGSPLMGNSLYYFGAYPTGPGPGSQGIQINACGRNLNGPDGTSTNKWDVECESTTSGVEISGYYTTSLNTTTTYNVYFNFHGCQDAILRNNQSPQGSSVNGNSTTVVTNPAVAQITFTDGNILTAGGTATGSGSGVISVGDAAIAPSGTPSGGGILYGAAGQPQWLDTAGKFWNLAQADWVSANEAGLLWWNYDPALMGSSQVPASGTVQAIRVPFRRATPVTNVILHQVTAGSTLTSGQNFAGLWDSTGARLGITADQTTSWGSGTNVFKTMALVSGPFTPTTAFGWILALSVGTTPPAWGTINGFNNATAANAGLGANNSRFATGATSQTALPSGSVTPGTYFTLAGRQYWGGVS